MKLRQANKVWDRQSQYRASTRARARRRVLQALRRRYPERHTFAVAT